MEAIKSSRSLKTVPWCKKQEKSITYSFRKAKLAEAQLKEKIASEHKTGMIPYMGLIYLIGQEELPLRKTMPIIKWGERFGLSSLTKGWRGKNYPRVLHFLANSKREMHLAPLKGDNARPHAIIVDESTDVSVRKQLIVLSRYFISTTFLALLHDHYTSLFSIILIFFEILNFPKFLIFNPLYRSKIQHTFHNDYPSNTKCIGIKIIIANTIKFLTSSMSESLLP